jgi:1-acyl-sn-glycerol-3-phosphate acyltransferase
MTLDRVPARVSTGLPRRGNAVTRAFGRGVLRAMGWRIQGDLPDTAKAVIVAAPHTAAIDLIVGLAGKVALGVEVHWFGKHGIFRPPLGWLLRWLGGMPVDRAAAGGIVRQAVEAFAARERFILAMAPEGTRRRVERWKTGFYRIAADAGVPIVTVALDFGSRTIRLDEPFRTTGDAGADIERLRSRFRSDMARFPELYAE